MKVIPKFSGTRFHTKTLQQPLGNTDVLVFVFEKPGGVRHFKQVRLEGDLPLHDKLIKYIGQHEEPPFQDWPEKTHGPYYLGNLYDTTVMLPSWDSFKEFRDSLEYEYMRRRPMKEKIDDDGLIDYIEGRALDKKEFDHLYMR